MAIAPKKLYLGNKVERDYYWFPLVTVTIPCYNEGEQIYNTINSVSQQTWPKDKLEIIVMDDCSTDNSYDWALKAQKKSSNVFVYKNKKNSGKRISLVEATKKAKGEICISVDSDVNLDRNAIKELISCFAKNPKIAAVGGQVGVSNANYNWITKTQTIKYYFGYELFKSIENLFRSVMCLSGCLTAYRKEALFSIEHHLEDRRWLGFPIKYGEDRFLTHLLVLDGWQTIINFDAKCHTKSPTNIKALFSQQLRWRRSNIIDWLYTLKHLHRHTQNINIIVLFNYFALALYILLYPLIISISIMMGWIVSIIFLHLVILAFLTMIYVFCSIFGNADKVYDPIAYLALGFILPISYYLLTPLALFTLDSGSWETRG